MKEYIVEICKDAPKLEKTLNKYAKSNYSINNILIDHELVYTVVFEREVFDKK